MHAPVRRILAQSLIAGAIVALTGCASFPNHGTQSSMPPDTGKPHGKCHPSSTQAGLNYVVFGKRYHVLDDARGYDERGIASWYGPGFHGKLTSSGMTYDMYAMTAASKVLPLCTWVKVSNLKSGKSVILQVNDRGPFVRNRIIDLSYTAAKTLGVVRNGTALVEVQAIANPSAQPPKDIAKVSQTFPVKELHHRAELYVQLGAFADHGNAERLRAHLLLRQLG
ncbi:MAG: septal ring lytic transglycosylase RlpA family protein, partial [Gammaproteobacteria bacterium]